MACVLIPFHREKARADNFLITASVSLLNVEKKNARKGGKGHDKVFSFSPFH